ncbi:hypothetical protein MO867_21285 [Microbulbifer sp. OS29]|uniref:Condensation domain-containing protein n=1 Tax=Microbulbifer okhotskensis TaxID=2926617 RepID=A0A9X2ESA5_9GAMM|nr:hypothetical protein [Microbulbifer okhotskensis]MCO1336865.1 hypothetical protein [Microbulbifer okhotskensis]
MCKEPLSRELRAQQALLIVLIKKSHDGMLLVLFVGLCDSIGSDQLMGGFAFLHNRRPILRARVEVENRLRWLCVVAFESIPFSVRKFDGIFDFESEHLWHENSYIGVEKYVYSITLYVNQKNEVERVVVIDNHAALDGRSIMALFCDLDDFLEPYKYFDARDIESFFDSTGSCLPSAGHLGAESTPQGAGDPQKWLVEKIAPVFQRRRHVILRLLSPEIVAYFVLFNRREQVSLAKIYYAMALFAAQGLPTYPGTAEVTFSIDSGALCGPPNGLDVAGTYSAMANSHTSIEVRLGGLIDPSRNLQEQLILSLSNRAPFAISFDSGCQLSDVVEFTFYVIAQSPIFSFGMIVHKHAVHPLMVITCATSQHAEFVFGCFETLNSHDGASHFVVR